MHLETYYTDKGMICSSLVECLLMVQQVIRSILQWGSIELFLILTSVPQLVCAILIHIKILIGKNSPCSGDRGFPLYNYMNGPLQYASCHITKNKMSVSLNKTFPSFLHYTDTDILNKKIYLVFSYGFKRNNTYITTWLKVMINATWCYQLGLIPVYLCMKQTLND